MAPGSVCIITYQSSISTSRIVTCGPWKPPLLTHLSVPLFFPVIMKSNATILAALVAGAHAQVPRDSTWSVPMSLFHAT